MDAEPTLSRTVIMTPPSLSIYARRPLYPVARWLCLILLCTSGKESCRAGDTVDCVTPGDGRRYLYTQSDSEMGSSLYPSNFGLSKSRLGANAAICVVGLWQAGGVDSGYGKNKVYTRKDLEKCTSCSQTTVPQTLENSGLSCQDVSHYLCLNVRSVLEIVGPLFSHTVVMPNHVLLNRVGGGVRAAFALFFQHHSSYLVHFNSSIPFPPKVVLTLMTLIMPQIS